MPEIDWGFIKIDLFNLNNIQFSDNLDIGTATLQHSNIFQQPFS